MVDPAMIKRGALVVSILAVATVIARADGLAETDELATLRSQIGWGASINPDHVAISSEGGYNGGDHRAQVAATVEATVIARTSVFATAQYGGVSANARPAIGAAYQLIDPRTSVNGARISLAYKPEGFTEPEGEVESVLVLSRRVHGDVLRAMLAYGQDLERRESDMEVGGSYLHRISPSFVIGATSRYRRAIKVNTLAEPRWDFIAGAVGGFVRGRSRIELLVGVDSIGYPSPAQTGVLGLVSVGTEI